MRCNQVVRRMRNKSFITNALSLLLFLLGLVSPWYRDLLRDVGLFALSGAVTNWLAIYMLFEKVPFLYGSGVIPARFEDFKRGIAHLIMNQFFTRENVERFLKFSTLADSNVLDSSQRQRISAQINYDQIYDELIKLVELSSLGGMLALFGGPSLLNQFREPFSGRMRQLVEDFLANPELVKGILGSHQDLTQDLLNKIEQVVYHRLDELTPQMVKEIIQQMIQQHLGWLVVWGGVFGGLIGLGSYCLS